MPHTKAAKKDLRQNRRRREQNKAVASEMRTWVKRVLESVEKKDAEAARKDLPVAQKKIDKASRRHLLHRNTASRRKSSLARKVQGLG